MSRVYSVSLAEVANSFGTQGWCALWIHLGFPSISLAYLASAIPQKLRGNLAGSIEDVVGERVINSSFT